MPDKCTESVMGECESCHEPDSFQCNSGGRWSSGISFLVQTFCQRTTYSRIPIQAFLQLIFGHHTYISFWLQTLQNSHIIFVLNLFNSHHMCCRPQRRKLWLQATQNKANFHKAIPWKDRFKPSTLIRGDNILSKVRPLLCVMWYCSSRGPDVQYIRGVLWSCLASQQG